MNLRRAVPAVTVLAVLGAAAATGHAVAGPAPAPNLLPAPTCPAVLGDALPTGWPSSTYLVPWGPVSARVCDYPLRGHPTPETAPVGTSVALDATAAAALAGLLEDLPAASGRCAVRADGGSGASDVVVAVLRYRPGATPTVGERLRLVLRRSGPCVTASNGLVTVQVDRTTLARLGELAAPLRDLR